MKLLIVTQYFPPEIGAPQNRLYELAVRLQKSGVDITVITAMPNYPQMIIHKEYIGKKYAFEKMGEIKVHRTSMPRYENRIGRSSRCHIIVFTSWVACLHRRSRGRHVNDKHAYASQKHATHFG